MLLCMCKHSDNSEWCDAKWGCAKYQGPYFHCEYVNAVWYLWQLCHHLVSKLHTNSGGSILEQIEIVLWRSPNLALNSTLCYSKMAAFESVNNPSPAPCMCSSVRTECLGWRVFFPHCNSWGRTFPAAHPFVHVDQLLELKWKQIPAGGRYIWQRNKDNSAGSIFCF